MILNMQFENLEYVSTVGIMFCPYTIQGSSSEGELEGDLYIHLRLTSSLNIYVTGSTAEVNEAKLVECKLTFSTRFRKTVNILHLNSSSR